MAVVKVSWPSHNLYVIDKTGNPIFLATQVTAKLGLSPGALTDSGRIILSGEMLTLAGTMSKRVSNAQCDICGYQHDTCLFTHRLDGVGLKFIPPLFMCTRCLDSVMDYANKLGGTYDDLYAAVENYRMVAEF